MRTMALFSAKRGRCAGGQPVSSSLRRATPLLVQWPGRKSLAREKGKLIFRVWRFHRALEFPCLCSPRGAERRSRHQLSRALGGEAWARGLPVFERIARDELAAGLGDDGLLLELHPARAPLRSDIRLHAHHHSGLEDAVGAGRGVVLRVLDARILVAKAVPWAMTE